MKTGKIYLIYELFVILEYRQSVRYEFPRVSVNNLRLAKEAFKNIMPLDLGYRRYWQKKGQIWFGPILWWNSLYIYKKKVKLKNNENNQIFEGSPKTAVPYLDIQKSPFKRRNFAMNFLFF